MGTLEEIRNELAENRLLLRHILDLLRARGITVDQIDPKAIYRMKEAAFLSNVSRATLDRWRDTGRLIPVEHNRSCVTGAQLIAAINDKRPKEHAIKNRKERA